MSNILQNWGHKKQGEMPLIGLGTYQLVGGLCRKVIEMALDIGYRHIDTAIDYGNHAEIAKGIKGFDRTKLFITSKFFLDLTDESAVDEICAKALNELKIDYLDLMLIHWPDRSKPMDKILAALAKVVQTGKIRSYGVSNFTEHHLEDMYNAGLKVPYNQVEFHPFLYQKHLLDFCRKNGTQLVSYRPLGKGQLVKEFVFAEIGDKYGKTPAQVILRWVIQQGIPVIPKASSEKHLRENFNIFDFELTEAEVLKINGLNQNIRYCNTDWSEFSY